MTAIFPMRRTARRRAVRSGLAVVLLGVLLGLAFELAAAHAQNVPPPLQLPGAAEPGRQAPEPAAPVESPPSLGLSFAITVPAGIEPPPDLAKEPLEITSLEIRGATAFQDGDFDAIRAPLIGKPTTVGDLFAAARAVDARYKAAGYFLSFAFLPEQETGDGRFFIQVIEGSIAKIAVQGDASSTLADTVTALLQPITRDRPASLAMLERRMLLINDLPGIRGRGILQPGPEPGTSELVIDLDYTPVAASLSADNRGSKFSGPVTATATATLNSLLGLGERVTIVANTARPTKESRFGQIEIAMPLGSDGGRVIASYSRNLSKPGINLKELGVKTFSNAFSLGTSYPLLRDRTDILQIGATLGWKDTGTDLLGERISRDRIRSLRLDLSWSGTIPTEGFLNAALALTQGLPVAGAPKRGSSDPSRRDVDSRFTKLTLDLFFQQPLFEFAELRWSASGQTTTRPLFAAEEFSVGGARFGRGYRGGEVSGEHGLATALELSVPVSSIFGLPVGLHPYGFWDAGIAWQDNVAKGATASLASAGFGLRLTAFGVLSGAVELARPLTRPASDRGRRLDNALYWSVASQF